MINSLPIAIIQNLIHDRGTDWSTSILITDANGTPISLSGLTGFSQIREDYSSINATANLVVNLASGANGIVVLSLDSNTSGAIYPGNYVYDILVANLVANTANNITQVARGIFLVRGNATQLSNTNWPANIMYIDASSNLNPTILANGATDSANNGEI